MTTKAISCSSREQRSNGFFLQVEGASIDKQDHAANACAQIGETVAFDKAIGVALDYQRTHPDTLIVVTADHGHTSQIVAEDANGTAARPATRRTCRPRTARRCASPTAPPAALTRPAAATTASSTPAPRSASARSARRRRASTA